ncbi:MAG: hypothetical protein Q8N99_02320 [Nanoarchaeota archaeon]|nr:hypothetical protein [Nanoarchaeota archaeon]
MKRQFIITISIFSIIMLSIMVSAASIDSEIKKLTNYAGEYETGNINYVQFLIYSSAVRENMNEVLGATGKEMGGILKEEQLKSVLGQPTEETKWVWVENEEKEKKMDNPVPAWRKIVFDGRKIQIRLNAWPSIFSKREFKEDNGNEDEKNKNKELEDLEGKLIYRLNFEIEFKKPEEQLNIQDKIDNIKALAQTFNSDPSSGNAETLAKESVNAERVFESYFRQSGGKCEDIMGGIFGTENKRNTQKLFVQEISFCEGDNFEVIARLEMCDECEWNWINVDFRFEGRGPGFKLKEGEMSAISPKSFENMDSADFELEVKRIVDEIKQSCGNKNFDSIMASKNKLWPLNEAWSQKSNDVWKELDKTFQSKTESMTQEQRQEFDQNYGWIKQEQEKKKKAKELSKSNYEKRKQFYLNLFSGYDKKEFYFTQIEYEKRLIEEFKERGEEICDNNIDDNKNEAIDCDDGQCGGKICGKRKNIMQEGNETKEMEVDFYCIEKECKQREEIQQVVRNISRICQELPPIECSEGSRVFFSRYDNETNCPIETSCLEETESCKVNEDCRQPACGIVECMENKCKVTGLKECRELECSDGDERICESDGRIVEICNNGFWEKTGECQQESEVKDEVIVGNECLSANDCGSDNICNNGICQMLPKVIITEPVEEISSEEHEEEQEQTPSEPEPSPETQESEPGTTGNIIFRSVIAFFSKMSITGFAITGFDVEEVPSEPMTSSTQPSGTPSETNKPEPNQEQNQQIQQIENQLLENQPSLSQEQQMPQDNQQPRENIIEDDRRQEDERRNQENKERCKKECIRPCIEKCIRGECGEELDCAVEEAQKKCEGTCEPKDDCVEKCMQGGDWWKEFENKDENKEEKGVFQVGGSCRTSQGKTEGFIWFGGWGDPFEQIQYLKNKYYSGGQSDWCKNDFENFKKQRQEFEKGFNQEFINWFFEKYLANSAENWEQSVSGIFELYWKDVDNSREMAYRMQCLGIDELPDINLINVKYDSEYGSIEFWEEIKTVKLPGMDKEVKVVSPYMKAWVFPTKEFIGYEMKKAMKNHEFPGSPEQKMERKNEEGPTAEEREIIKQDKKFMDNIREITKKYDGNLDAVIRLIDNETVVFNLYVQVNENDILKVKPMLPEEVPQEDIKVDIEFQKIFDIIYTQEKEMRGQRIESPPWDRKTQPMQNIKDVVNGVKMYFKARDILNSAKIYPETSKKDAKTLMKSFFSMMMKSEKGKPGMETDMKDDMNNGDIGEEKGVWEEKEKITGEVILS